MNLPPLETPVNVTTRLGRTFTAMRRDFGFPDCDWCWVAAPDTTPPNCWTDGICWIRNEDGKPSDPVVSWEGRDADIQD